MRNEYRNSWRATSSGDEGGETSYRRVSRLTHDVWWLTVGQIFEWKCGLAWVLQLARYELRLDCNSFGLEPTWFCATLRIHTPPQWQCKPRLPRYHSEKQIYIHTNQSKGRMEWCWDAAACLVGETTMLVGPREGHLAKVAIMLIENWCWTWDGTNTWTVNSNLYV